MADYTKTEARAWAKENFRGTVAVTMPSYTPDFSGINENAIRHDILKLKELTGRKIQPQTFKHVRTVGDVVDAIEKLMASPNP